MNRTLVCLGLDNQRRSRLVRRIAAFCLALASAGAAFGAPVKTAVVVIGHGIIAKNYPADKMAAYRNVMSAVEKSGGEQAAPDSLKAQMAAMDLDMRAWPRTAENDPYDASVQQLARDIQKVGHYDIVEVAFNEFCGQDVDDAITAAVDKGASRVIVMSTMLIKGGDHADREILGKIIKARAERPQADVRYVWPIDELNMAHFFVGEIDRVNRN